MDGRNNGGFLSRWYACLASGRLALALMVLYFVSQGLIAAILHRLGSDPLTLQTTFSKEVFEEILRRWGGPGTALYMRHFYLDFFHPAIYSLFLSSAIAYFTAQKGQKPRTVHLVLFALPYIAGLCDLAENILHVGMIQGYLPITGCMVLTSGTFTNTKWALAAVSVLAVIALGMQKAVSFARQKG